MSTDQPSEPPKTVDRFDTARPDEAEIKSRDPGDTMVLPKASHDSPDSPFNHAVDALPVALPALISGIINRLKHYVDNPDVLQDFQPMAEWGLAAQGRLSEADILQAYIASSKIPVVDGDELTGLDVFEGISYDYLQNQTCIPLYWDDTSIILAIASPYDIDSISHHWQVFFGLEASFLLARRSHIERAITSFYEEGNQDGIDDLAFDADNTSEAALRDLAKEAPIVRLVSDMFSRALEMGASDIHVEPEEESLSIRFRVDGILQTIMTPPIGSYAAISSRIKLIGGLNIAERRLPQDGRTELRIGRNQIDIRISTVPALHGESIVMRLLTKDIVNYSIENMGMDKSMQDAFTRLVKLPHGMILVVGPTGSGKTTSLYCVMRLLNSEHRKIITIEDPIEYQIKGVTQIQVKPSIGMTFAGGLRHIVRQDPDIILVGEIRDRETAEIAIHAALTGHLVLSTLHTNDATGAISRLIDMGVEDFLISSALVGVLSQRLVRRVCTDCKGSGLQSAQTDRNVKPCKACSGTGYRGRHGIFEFLEMSEEVRAALRDGTDNASLNRIARTKGMKSLREDGHRLVDLGITTKAEVARVCQLDT